VNSNPSGIKKADVFATAEDWITRNSTAAKNVHLKGQTYRRVVTPAYVEKAIIYV
jgi:hypothetical protein